MRISTFICVPRRKIRGELKISWRADSVYWFRYWLEKARPTSRQLNDVWVEFRNAELAISGCYFLARYSRLSTMLFVSLFVDFKLIIYVLWLRVNNEWRMTSLILQILVDEGRKSSSFSCYSRTLRNIFRTALQPAPSSLLIWKAERSRVKARGEQAVSTLSKRTTISCQFCFALVHRG